MGSLLTAHFWLYFGKLKGDFMGDYKPIITQEEWEQFIQEFGLEREIQLDDDAEFFHRLDDSPFEGGNW